MVKKHFYMLVRPLQLLVQTPLFRPQPKVRQKKSSDDFAENPTFNPDGVDFFDLWTQLNYKAHLSDSLHDPQLNLYI